MGLFGGRATARKLRRRADKHAERAIVLLQTGHCAEAFRHSQLAVEAISELRRIEPAEPEHVVQLAGKLYNHAAILDQLGRAAEAVGSARHSLELYRSVGGELAPDAAALAAGLHRIRAFLHPPSGRPEELALMTADVKARLARLLAQVEGPAAAAEVRTLGREALVMYERLATVDERHAAGLNRVRVQVAIAEQFVSG